MKNESVAILDVRSYEVTFSLGAKGVNDTFVLFDSHTEKYEGFSAEGFFDEESFRHAVVSAITSVRQNYEGVIGKIYVSVPSAFITVATKGHTLSFPSKRKISQQDVDALYESGLNELLATQRCIRRSAMYFTLGDNRKYFNVNDIYGVASSVLKGALCYYFIDDSFYDLTLEVLRNLEFNEVHFLPSTLAQALYLLPEKRREGYAFLLDIGFMTSSVSVVYGNGIVREDTFTCGIGMVIASLMQHLQVDYALAEEILSTANVSGGTLPRDLVWTSEKGDASFSVQTINDIIKYGLDVLCEAVEKFFETHYREKNTVFAVNPIGITGEGISAIAGAAEHISKRLNRLTEIIYPDLPYYDKPTFSSRISLLNMALSDKQKRGWFKRIFNGFGGKKK
jgi:cell division ATPase FtsA